jgi:hypothetical protein
VNDGTINDSMRVEIRLQCLKLSHEIAIHMRTKGDQEAAVTTIKRADVYANFVLTRELRD